MVPIQPSVKTLRKNVHTMVAQNVHESNTILCGGKLQTFMYQQIEYALTEVFFLLQLKHQVSIKEK